MRNSSRQHKGGVRGVRILSSQTGQKYVLTPHGITQENRQPHWNYPKFSKYRKPLGIVKQQYRNLKSKFPQTSTQTLAAPLQHHGSEVKGDRRVEKVLGNYYDNLNIRYIPSKGVATGIRLFLCLMTDHYVLNWTYCSKSEWIQLNFRWQY